MILEDHRRERNAEAENAGDLDPDTVFFTAWPFRVCGPWPRCTTSPGSLLEVENLKPHSRSIESKSLVLLTASAGQS